jgi:hypothetical protein
VKMSVLTEGTEDMDCCVFRECSQPRRLHLVGGDLLRGDYKQSEYAESSCRWSCCAVWPCVLEPSKDKVLQRLES